MDHILGHERLLTVAVGMKGMVIVAIVIVSVFNTECENKTFKPILLWNYILEHCKMSRFCTVQRQVQLSCYHTCDMELTRGCQMREWYLCSEHILVAH